ncbi:hypothetical protein [Mesobacillus stamsii]|uniref:Metal-dependent amidase/aminoacylase/carboxypeptidase family protein n=1 Tax=Mesobacillus stamsii TaxID=225347 RepID=A0ABU0FU88_9BACI|nr:hypothetical protein [Mesobacillus stamsii]MDQ0413320.1 metal-dependent amidase/aminoacylase/carboxypeptidase family protein [Mesobacillus stamsii]
MAINNSSSVQPEMGAKDFSYYLLHTPVAFVFVGIGGEKVPINILNDLDEAVLPIAIKLFIEIMKAYDEK